MSEVDKDNLQRLFNPRSVALVGANEGSGFSQAAFDNLKRSKLAAHTYLLTKHGREVHGRPTVTSYDDLPERIDVAFLLLQQSAVKDALTQAAEAGVRNAVVLASGYAESGEDGIEAQRELVEHASGLGMVVLGPNHLGFANFAHGAPVAAIPDLPQVSGPVALISQSGAVANVMLEFGRMIGVGFSQLVTVGNQAMISVADVLDYLANDPASKSIAMFVESIGDPDSFRKAAAHARAAGKPVVAVKIGKSELSARTAAAHTGALVGVDAITGAVFRDLGVIRVESIEDLLTTAAVASQVGQLRRPGIGAISISGGTCSILTDLAHKASLQLPELQGETVQQLREFMPSFGTVQNPLDITGAAMKDPSMFTRAINTMSQDPSIGVIIVVHGIPWRPIGEQWPGQQLVDAIGSSTSRADVPIVQVTPSMHPITATTRSILDKAGVELCIAGLQAAVTALSKLSWWSSIAVSGPEMTEDPNIEISTTGIVPRGRWSEQQVRELLSGMGVPTIPAIVVSGPEEASKAAARIGGPVSVKVLSPDIQHKSDIGGVVVGVEGDEPVRAAFTRVMMAASQVVQADIQGALISPLRKGGIEIHIGVSRDRAWGQVMAVATGGTFVEYFGDAVLLPLPTTTARIRAALDSLRCAPLLKGERNYTPANMTRLVEIVARIGALAQALGDNLEVLEINPLFVDGDVIEALDALVEWTLQEQGRPPMESEGSPTTQS